MVQSTVDMPATLDPIIGGGTAFNDLLTGLLTQLGNVRDDRARALIQMIQLMQSGRAVDAGTLQSLATFLEAIRQFDINAQVGLLDSVNQQLQTGATINNALLATLNASQQFDVNTKTQLAQQITDWARQGAQQDQNLLDSLQLDRQRGGTLAEQLLADIQSGRLRGGELLRGLYEAGTGYQLGRGQMGNTLLGNITSNIATRGGLAEGLFGQLLGAEKEARRNPLGLVDQLSLAGQFGTTLPLSQTGSEQLSQFGLTPGSLTGDVQSELMNLIRPNQQFGDVSALVQSLMASDPQLAQMLEEARTMAHSTQQEADISSFIMGSTQPTATETGLVGRIQEGNKVPVQAQMLLQSALKSLSPSATQQELIDTIQQQGRGHPLTNLLIQNILRLSSVPSAQVQDIVTELQGLIGPGPQEQAATDLLQTYGQGAVSQARILDVFAGPNYASGDDSVLFVQLPDGGVEQVKIRTLADGTILVNDQPVNTANGLLTIQGQRGPFTIAVDDYRALRQQQIGDEDNFAANLNRLPEGDRAAVKAQRDQQRQARFYQFDHLARAFRTATPSQFTDLVNFLAADPATQALIGNTAAPPGPGQPGYQPGAEPSLPGEHVHGEVPSEAPYGGQPGTAPAGRPLTPEETARYPTLARVFPAILARVLDNPNGRGDYFARGAEQYAAYSETSLGYGGTGGANNPVVRYGLGLGLPPGDPDSFQNTYQGSGGGNYSGPSDYNVNYDPNAPLVSSLTPEQNTLYGYNTPNADPNSPDFGQFLHRQGGKIKVNEPVAGVGLDSGQTLFTLSEDAGKGQPELAEFLGGGDMRVTSTKQSQKEIQQGRYAGEVGQQGGTIAALLQEIIGAPRMASGGTIIHDIQARKARGTATAEELYQLPGVYRNVDPSLYSAPRDTQLRYLNYGDEGNVLADTSRPGVVGSRLDRASNPGYYDPVFNPTAVASRLLGRSLSADVRFRDPFIEALSLGYRPSPTSLNAYEFSRMSQEQQNALGSIVGEDLFPTWVRELGLLSPRGMQGVRQRALGGVRT